MSRRWRPEFLSFSKWWSVRKDALFIAAVVRQCQLRSSDLPLTPRVILLLWQFVWPPQQYCPGTPLANSSSDLSGGLALRSLYSIASVEDRFSFTLNHQITRNHQRVFPLPHGMLRHVSSQRMLPGKSPSTPSRFYGRPGVSTTLVFPFCTHLIVAEISAPQRAYTCHIWRVFPTWVFAAPLPSHLWAVVSLRRRWREFSLPWE